MLLASQIVVGLLAALHVYILVVEMFLWDTPYGRKAFGLAPEFSASTKVLAANQGLYNGFLAAGLVWGLLTPGAQVELFFLGCILVAGVYGAATSSRKILFVQAVPASLGIALVLLSR